jgi:NAD(P)-dependent dehydrogenase (short-subunit alcohol dehydrogenase family)
VDNGRIIYIGSSTTEHPVSGCGLYGGSKMAPRYLVEILAQDVGHRGVTVNSIIPTTIDNAGVFTGGADQRTREWVASFRPMKRMGRSRTSRTRPSISRATSRPSSAVSTCSSAVAHKFERSDRWRSTEGYVDDGTGARKRESSAVPDHLYDLRYFKYAIAAAELGSFRRAAEVLSH